MYDGKNWLIIGAIVAVLAVLGVFLFSGDTGPTKQVGISPPPATTPGPAPAPSPAPAQTPK